MRIEIEHIQGRTARARVVDEVLLVRMPGHWPPSTQEQTVARFLRWAHKQVKRTVKLPPLSDEPMTEWTPGAFDAYVRRLNDESFKVPVAAVRIGSARRSRLAQANTRTRVLTFSRHAITGMPEQALRYLILHELAHLLEANHSSRFWALVEAFEPDYKRQRAIAVAHHSRMIDRLEKLERAHATAPRAALDSAAPPLGPKTPTALAAPPMAEGEGHLFGPLFAFLPQG